MIELQNLDCNCNNCIHMIRNMEKFKESLKSHHRWQLDYFNTQKNETKNFQFDKSTCCINYGTCDKLNKEVSFIPDTLQLDTQECFTNRKQNKHEEQ